VYITVNGNTDSYAYNQEDTDVAAGLAAAINADSKSLVTATANNSTITLTSKTTGSLTNYAFSTSAQTNDPQYFSGPSFCNPCSPSSGALTGGANAVYAYDSGTVSATVNSCTGSVGYSQSTNSNADEVASALAAAVGTACSVDVKASASNTAITLTTTATGANADDYTLSASSASNDPSQFPTPSFRANAGNFSGGSDTGINTPWQTLYTYDPLNDLTSVTQNGSSSSSARVRNFAYDSFGRLTSATNPETGTISYGYDLDSNLTSKVSPEANQVGSSAQTTITYTYDALNRLTKKTYSDPSQAKVVYAYDGAALAGYSGPNAPTINSPTNLVGRRSAMGSPNSASSWSYDPMGRPLEEARVNVGASSATYDVNYAYYLDGSLNTLTYPSGDVLTYAVGGAGRPLSASDSSNSYAASATYAPQGSLAGMANGYTASFAGIVTSNVYNNRLQPILLSASASSKSVFSLCYDFHLSVAVNKAGCSLSQYATGDNGNVFQVINNVDSTRSAAFQYDTLNRIQQANTINTTSSNCWGEVYTIDAWGNLTNISGVSSMPHCYTEGLAAAPASANNQLNGYCYDGAGNLLLNAPCPTGTFTPAYTYDDENRLSTVSGYTYDYDGDGARMEKASGTTGTMYWPGPGGKVLTETDLSGNINEEYVYFNGERIARIDRPTGTVHYYFSNHLGSASVITDASGNIQEQTDYYPYGGIAYSNGGDPNHYKFTGKERDAESGLDMFGARYYGSSLGRFMTPDWAAKPTAVPYASFGNPQSLNLYSYVNNNPTTTRDPDGHCLEDACVIEGGIVITAMAVSYLSSPPGQQMLHNAVSGITSLGSSISSFFHPDNSGQNAAPPPTTPTNVSQGTPGTTATNVATGTPASTSQQGAVNTGAMPLIVVSPGGDAIPVPNGASGPVPVVNNAGNTTGFGYTGGSGGNGLSDNTTGVRVMDPTPARGASPGYPNGYVSYGNSSGQTVNGQTGQTVPRSDPSAHVPLSSPKPCPSGGSCQ